MGHGLVDLVFKVHRGLVTERAVEPRAVVKNFDPLEDGGAGFGVGGEGAAMDQFAFEAAPEAFHGGVVVAVATSTHARHGPRLGQALPVIAAGVLDALIGVMEQSAVGTALRERHVERGQWQRGGQRVTHRPANAPAAAPVQNPRHIEEAFLSFHIGDVSHPDGIGTCGLIPLQQPVGSHRQVVVTVGQAHGVEPPPQATVQADLSHQPGDAHAATGLAVVTQPVGDARTAVSLTAFLMRLLDQRQQCCVGLRPMTRRAARPRVIPAGRHFQCGAQQVHGVFVAHGFHKLKSFPDGVAMMPSVFLECPAAAPDGAPHGASAGSPLRAAGPNAAPGRWPASPPVASSTA
jgi:hypothetical protein